MNTMTMPGFAAETSLYRPSRPYRSTGIVVNFGSNRHVMPQLPIGFCMANCNHIQDPLMRQVCNLNCLGQAETGSGGDLGTPGCSLVVGLVVLSLVVRGAGRLVLMRGAMCVRFGALSRKCMSIAQRGIVPVSDDPTSSMWVFRGSGLSVIVEDKETLKRCFAPIRPV